MKLKILLPHQILLEENNVEKIVVETSVGVMGVLPQLHDCVAVLDPGILTYEPVGKPPVCLAVSSGVLVKSGCDVAVSVLRAVIGPDLPELRVEMERHFRNLDESERELRTALARVELGRAQPTSSVPQSPLRVVRFSGLAQNRVSDAQMLSGTSQRVKLDLNHKERNL
jgi:F-type H+-transporting ATPase subunit epsilon